MRLPLLLVVLLATACGGSFTPAVAQRGIEVGAVAVQESDEELAPIVSQRVQSCEAEHEYSEDFLACVEPYTPIRHGVALARRGVLVAQATVDTWHTAENAEEVENHVLAIFGCIGYGLGQIAGAVRSLELDAVDEEIILAQILQWTDTVGGWLEPMCPAPTYRELMGERDE